MKVTAEAESPASASALFFAASTPICEEPDDALELDCVPFAGVAVAGFSEFAAEVTGCCAGGFWAAMASVLLLNTAPVVALISYSYFFSLV